MKMPLHVNTYIHTVYMRQIHIRIDIYVNISKFVYLKIHVYVYIFICVYIMYIYWGVGWSGPFSASHFLRPKIYFAILRFRCILKNVYIYYHCCGFSSFDNKFMRIYVFPEDGFFKKVRFIRPPTVVLFEKSNLELHCQAMYFWCTITQISTYHTTTLPGNVLLVYSYPIFDLSYKLLTTS
jgi:hypothetical protein